MTEAQHEPLTGEQLSELLRVVRGADSVELKVTVPDANRRSTVAALELDPLGAQIRQVVFIDTPDLALYQQGVVVRARRVQRKVEVLVYELSAAHGRRAVAVPRWVAHPRVVHEVPAR